MLKIQEIREIIKLIDQSDIEEFAYEHEGSKVEMKKRSNSLHICTSSMRRRNSAANTGSDHIGKRCTSGFS